MMQNTKSSHEKINKAYKNSVLDIVIRRISRSKELKVNTFEPIRFVDPIPANYKDINSELLGIKKNERFNILRIKEGITQGTNAQMPPDMTNYSQKPP